MVNNRANLNYEKNEMQFELNDKEAGFPWKDNNPGEEFIGESYQAEFSDDSYKQDYSYEDANAGFENDKSIFDYTDKNQQPSFSEGQNERDNIWGGSKEEYKNENAAQGFQGTNQHGNYGWFGSKVNCCHEKKNTCYCEDQCIVTIAEIIKNIIRYGQCIPIKVYLNSPSCLTANSCVTGVDLHVAENASVSGKTNGESVKVSGCIDKGAINVATKGCVNIPGLEICPENVHTGQVSIPVSIESNGTVCIDLSQGTAVLNIPRLPVEGCTAAKTVPVEITQTKPLCINTGHPDKVCIPSLDVCCEPCRDGSQWEYDHKGPGYSEEYGKGYDNDWYNNQKPQGNTWYDNYGNKGGHKCNDSCNDECKCVRLGTKPVQVQTEGCSNYVDIPVGSVLKGCAAIPSTRVSGQTAPECVSANLKGQASSGVATRSVPGSLVSIPKIGVWGNTQGVAGVPVTTTGTNINEVPISGCINVGSLDVCGVAQTRGIPVTGSVCVDTRIIQTPVSFTGIPVCINGNVLVLKDMCSDKRMVVSLCDISRIAFRNFPSIQCMAQIFKHSRLDERSCVYGIQKTLQQEKCNLGTIQLYGSSTNNPLTEPISTKDILLVDGGVLWIVNRGHEGCIFYDVYSLCNIAGYVFSGPPSPPPCPPPCSQPCPPQCPPPCPPSCSPPACHEEGKPPCEDGWKYGADQYQQSQCGYSQKPHSFENNEAPWPWE